MKKNIDLWRAILDFILKMKSLIALVTVVVLFFAPQIYSIFLRCIAPDYSYYMGSLVGPTNYQGLIGNDFEHPAYGPKKQNLDEFLKIGSRKFRRTSSSEETPGRDKNGNDVPNQTFKKGNCLYASDVAFKPYLSDGKNEIDPESVGLSPFAPTVLSELAEKLFKDRTISSDWTSREIALLTEAIIPTAFSETGNGKCRISTSDQTGGYFCRISVRVIGSVGDC
jgi:hypothetical protein